MQRTIPQILKKIRVDRDLSQENLAEEIKVDATTYGRYESGESQIKFEQVVQIAAFYKMTLDEFYHYGDPDFKAAEPRERYFRKKVNILVELDGHDTTYDFWVKKLKAINDVI